ncbi:MAG: hypothetical protein Tsb0033_03370 [Winogradskyella sp.]
MNSTNKNNSKNTLSKTPFKNFAVGLFIILIFLIGHSLFAQVGVGNTNPQAQLDISASNTTSPTNQDGILIPRVTNLPADASMTANQDGMMVFYDNTGEDGKGFYYWDDTANDWIKINAGIDQDNQTIDNFSLVGTILRLSLQDDGQPLQTVNLASLQDGTGTDDQNIQNLSFNSTTNVLTVGIENGTAQNVNLSSLDNSDHDWYTQNTTNEPNNINDNIYTQGKVAIGQTSGNGFLDILANNTGTQPHINLVDIGSSGSRINFTNTGTTNGNVWTVFGDTDNIAANSRFNLFHTGTGNIMVVTGDGNIGIGDPTPDATLDVNGNFQYTDGNQSNGYVLTTDANGSASWTNPSTLSVVTAINGLSATGNQVRLGGALNQNTTIANNTFDMIFNVNSSGTFKIQDGGVDKFEMNAFGDAVFGGDLYLRDENSDASSTILARFIDMDDDGRLQIYENGIVSIDLNANTAAVFNQQGLDRDFRVESNTNENMFLVDAGINRVSVGATNTAGTFNVTGNSFYSDDLWLRDGAVNSGDILARLYDSGDDGVLDIYQNNTVNHRIHGNGVTVFNEQGNNNADFRIESDTRSHMFWVDANENVVRIGQSTAFGLAENGNTRVVNGFTATVDYVADFEIDGTNRNTTTGIGSTEFLFDCGNLYVMLHGRLLPFDDNVRSLGTSNWRWQALWAGDGTINTSDLRQKKNIKPLEYGLEELMQVETLTFNWKKSSNPATKIGFSAQNLLKVLPEVVVTEEPVTINEETGAEEMRPVTNLGVYYSDIIPVTVKAIQELNTKIETLEAENSILKRKLSRLEQLEARIMALEINNKNEN